MNGQVLKSKTKNISYLKNEQDGDWHKELGCLGRGINSPQSAL